MKMKNRLVIFLTVHIMTLLSCDNATNYQDKPVGKKIVIETDAPAGYKFRDLSIQRGPADYVLKPELAVRRPEIANSKVKWILYSDKAIVVNLIRIIGADYELLVFEPGDSIYIQRTNGVTKFSGQGFEKFQLIESLKLLKSRFKMPDNRKIYEVLSEQDYWQWNEYLNKLLDSSSGVFKEYETRVKPNMLESIKQSYYSDLEYKRILRFGLLVGNSHSLKVSKLELERIFDSTMHSTQASWLRKYTGRPKHAKYYYDFVRRSIERRHHFNYNNDTLKSGVRKIEYTKLAKEIYKDEVLQSCLAYLLTNQGLKEHTLKGQDVSTIDSLLTDFYALPGNYRYKEYVKEYEKEVRKWIAEKNDKE